MKGFKNITVRENLAKILKIEARRLGYKSIGDYIEGLNALRTKMGWSKLDMEILAEYGKLPETTVMSEQELKEKGYRKVAEMPQIEKMPKSDEVFKNKEK